MMTRYSNQQGFSLMEVIVSMALLGIISAGIVPGFLNYFATITTNDVRTGAVNAAQVRLDALRIANPADLPSSGSDSVDINVGNYIFTVVTTYCLDASYCELNNTRHLHVDVNRNAETIYRVETIYTQLK